MGDIRYFIRDYVNSKRAPDRKSQLFIHEENSDSAQKHAQYILDEMLKWGRHRFWEIQHFNPFCHGEYNSENIGPSEGTASLEEHIVGIISDFDKDHWNNMMNPAWTHIGADAAYDNAAGLLILVQRFC
ncbi:hypothetical protein J4433_03110 [Candidatus Pacearchaeota archaeon]|nr:hypothetical protein [Candidatus Pacearchaeota archaeon]